jgi:hypothetical protein
MPNLNIDNGCRGVVGVCTVRFTLLDSTCAPVGGNNSFFVADAAANLSMTREYTTIAEIERTACAGKNRAWLRPEEKRLKRISLEGTLELFDPQAHNMLFGTTALTGGANSPVGWSGKIIGAADEIGASDPPRIAFEIWQETVDPNAEICSTVEGAETRVRRIFPLCRLWEADSADLATDQGMAVGFTGYSLANPQWSDIHGDWPADEELPSTSPHAWMWDATVPPAATCGVQDLAGS